MEDTVTVRKIKAVPAEKVIVAPLETIPPIDERYLADALESVPLIKGDNIMVPLSKEFGRSWHTWRRVKPWRCQSPLRKNEGEEHA